MQDFSWLARIKQAITINAVKGRIFHQAGSANCRLCGSHDETVDHLLSSCNVIAQTYYKKCHDVAAKIIHWELAKRGGFECATKWWEHCPQPVIQNDNMKLLWDFTVQTDRHLPHNRPDNFTKKHAFLIDIAIPGDSRISQKVNKKYQRCTDLKIEAQKTSVVNDSFYSPYNTWLTWFYPYKLEECTVAVGYLLH